jgi:hypothetical protein
MSSQPKALGCCTVRLGRYRSTHRKTAQSSRTHFTRQHANGKHTKPQLKEGSPPAGSTRAATTLRCVAVNPVIAGWVMLALFTALAALAAARAPCIDLRQQAGGA